MGFIKQIGIILVCGIGCIAAGPVDSVASKKAVADSVARSDSSAISSYRNSVNSLRNQRPDSASKNAVPANSAVAGQADTATKERRLSDSLMLAAGDTARTAPKKSAALAATLAAVLPGAGQFYTREYVRGGAVIIADGILGYYLYFYAQGANRESAAMIRELNTVAMLKDSISGIKFDTTHGVADSIRAVDTAFAATIYRIKADTARFERNKNRANLYQSAFWLGGTYLYSIMKAIDKSGQFRSETPKKPIVAGWLSAIPFLGLGQLYNGSFAKAGVVWMTQSSLACIALTNQNLMTDAERELGKVLAYSDYEVSPDIKAAYQSQWDSYRTKAFTDRNTFLWYFLLFYFYGIFDAVVDAHLHDYPAKMRLEPDLVPRAGGGVSFNLRYTF